MNDKKYQMDLMCHVSWPFHMAVLSVQASRERPGCGWVESQYESAMSTCTSGSML